jgi:predicted O-methyltransferase YrrM
MNLDGLKKIAEDNHVPIINDQGLLFLKQAIIQYDIKNVLEIGSAIGYSALAMASYGCYVDTIERDLDMIEKAKFHIDLFDHEHKVKLIPFDALSYTGPLKTYDMIFIDAAKSQYKKFFDKYEKYLNPNGIIICDNLRFHDLKPEQVNRHTKQLLRKINEFKTFLIEHNQFITEFFDTGDGMSISKRKI